MLRRFQLFNWYCCFNLGYFGLGLFCDFGFGYFGIVYFGFGYFGVEPLYLYKFRRIK